MYNMLLYTCSLDFCGSLHGSSTQAGSLSLLELALTTSIMIEIIRMWRTQPKLCMASNALTLPTRVQLQ